MSVNRITESFTDQDMLGPGSQVGGALFRDVREVLTDALPVSASVVTRGVMGRITAATISIPSEVPSEINDEIGWDSPTTCNVRFQPPVTLDGNNPAGTLDR